MIWVFIHINHLMDQFNTEMIDLKKIYFLTKTSMQLQLYLWSMQCSVDQFLLSFQKKNNSTKPPPFFASSVERLGNVRYEIKRVQMTCLTSPLPSLRRYNLVSIRRVHRNRCLKGYRYLRHPRQKTRNSFRKGCWMEHTINWFSCLRN